MEKIKDLYSWKAITIKQYDEITKIFEDKALDTISKTNELMSVVEGVDADELMNLSLPEWNERSKNLSFLNEFKIKDFSKDHIIISGVKYNISQDFSKLTVAQWMDYQHLSSSDKYDIAALLSVFLVPDGKKYGEGYDVLQLRSDLYNGCNFVIGESILSFIYTKYAHLLKDSLRYLVKLVRREKNKEKREILTRKYMEIVLRVKSSAASIFYAPLKTSVI